MLTLYFGDREVGTLSTEGATGVGATFFENGVEAFDAEGIAWTRDDGAGFVDAVERAINGAIDSVNVPYFHVERTPGTPREGSAL